MAQRRFAVSTTAAPETKTDGVFNPGIPVPGMASISPQTPAGLVGQAANLEKKQRALAVIIASRRRAKSTLAPAHNFLVHRDAARMMVSSTH